MIPKSEWDKLKREDSEALRDMILDKCKRNEWRDLILSGIAITAVTMLGNYLGLIEFGEKYLR